MSDIREKIPPKITELKKLLLNIKRLDLVRKRLGVSEQGGVINFKQTIPVEKFKINQAMFSQLFPSEQETQEITIYLCTEDRYKEYIRIITKKIVFYETALLNAKSEQRVPLEKLTEQEQKKLNGLITHLRKIPGVQKIIGIFNKILRDKIARRRAQETRRAEETPGGESTESLLQELQTFIREGKYITHSKELTDKLEVLVIAWSAACLPAPETVEYEEVAAFLKEQIITLAPINTQCITMEDIRTAVTGSRDDISDLPLEELMEQSNVLLQQAQTLLTDNSSSDTATVPAPPPRTTAAEVVNTPQQAGFLSALFRGLFGSCQRTGGRKRNKRTKKMRRRLSKRSKKMRRRLSKGTKKMRRRLSKRSKKIRRRKNKRI